ALSAAHSGQAASRAGRACRAHGDGLRVQICRLAPISVHRKSTKRDHSKPAPPATARRKERSLLSGAAHGSNRPFTALPDQPSTSAERHKAGIGAIGKERQAAVTETGCERDDA